MRSRKSEQQSSEGKRTVVLRESKAYIQCEQLPKFAWGQRWLKGNQYALMLLKMDQYCSKYSIQTYGFNQHPIHIYTKPQNGIIYFLKNNSLEQLGYPRIHSKKKYCWKKMNFPTFLPKADPLVKYLVASSFISGEIQQENKAVYRMHVVEPLKFESQYLLCHIRRVGEQQKESEVNEQDKQIKGCFEVEQVNFYRLLMHLHNRFHCQ